MQTKNICYHDGLACATCGLNKKLMCRFQLKDMAIFMTAVLVFWAAAVTGILFGYRQDQLPLWGLISFFVSYVVYIGVFLQVWENKILCSHCPQYAFTEDKRLSCYANAGLLKLWPYNPAPMTTSERIQFLIGLAFFYIIPAVFLIWGKIWLFLGLTGAFYVGWIIILQNSSCKKCPNFSCPLNRVSKETVDEYLRKNTVMQEAWVNAGYQLNPE
jgi:hypothetical protein